MKSRKKYLFLAGACLVAILVLCEIISTYRFHRSYQSISLVNASCLVPKRMWNPDSDEILISDHCFTIADADGKYLIYGSQLESYDAADEEAGFLVLGDGTDFSDFETIYQLKEAIKENSDLLETVTSSYEYSRSTFNSYRFVGTAGGDFAGYRSYVAVLRQNGMCFLEAILYREPEDLSEKEMKEIMLNLNWHRERKG